MILNKMFRSGMVRSASCLQFRSLSSLLALFSLMNATYGARILGLFPMPVKSHSIMDNPFMEELANRGHEVVVFSPFPQNKQIPNYTDIEFAINLPEIMKESGGKPNWFDSQGGSSYQMINVIWNVGNKICEHFYEDKFIQKLLNSNENFDLIIIGAFMYDCVLGMSHKFKVPVIEMCTFAGMKWMDDWVANPSFYSFVPNTLSEYTNKMTFWQRLSNTLSELYIKLGRKYYTLPKHNALLRKYFKEDIPTIEELERNISFVLVNSHFSFNYPRPLMPNYVEVGGLHVKPPKKLPAEIEKYIEESPHGVIFFSLGSNVRSSGMPENKRKAFIDAFSKLKQRILWKWEEETMPDLPKNVKLGKWLPQSDILAHPNVKLFMTHGGLLSTLELISRGVPIIGIPLIGDQRMNMAKMVSHGLGVKLDFANVTVESVTWAINEVMDNPKYRENVQRMSRIYRDQPLSPMEQAIFWTEYVIRHKGAPHMRSAALDLAWYQYFLLDVIAALLLPLMLTLYIVFLMLRNLFKICLKRKSNVPTKKKKN